MFTKKIIKDKEIMTFSEWSNKTFDWIDSDVKRYMRRAWNASQKNIKLK